MSSNFSNWNPYSGYVQAGMVDGNYSHAGFTMLAAGPPRLANIGGAAALAGALDSQRNDVVYPIGIVQNFSLSQSRNFSRLFEIGSERSYIVAGRSMGQMGLSRVYYHGASLLRVLYAYYQDAVPPTLVSTMFDNVGAQAMSNPHDVVIPPGYDNIFLNLASDLFAQPIGILLYVRDINKQTLSACYFEASYVPNHTFSMDAQSVLLQEQVGLQYERAVPVQVAEVGLITGGDSSGSNVTYPGVAE